MNSLHIFYHVLHANGGTIPNSDKTLFLSKSVIKFLIYLIFYDTSSILAVNHSIYKGVVVYAKNRTCR